MFVCTHSETNLKTHLAVPYTMAMTEEQLVSLRGGVGAEPPNKHFTFKVCAIRLCVVCACVCLNTRVWVLVLVPSRRTSTSISQLRCMCCVWIHWCGNDLQYALFADTSNANFHDIILYPYVKLRNNAFLFMSIFMLKQCSWPLCVQGSLRIEGETNAIPLDYKNLLVRVCVFLLPYIFPVCNTN